MIEIGDPGWPVPATVLDAPGGFCWWYLDLIDPAGNGVVLIWSYGLPFLPGYADAARRGEPERPRDRPSLNLVLYRAGQTVCYLLQEYGPGEADGEVDPACQRIGSSTFRLSQEGETLRLDAEVDCAVPGGPRRVQGRVRLRGVARRGGADGMEAPAAAHLWTPLTGPAEAEAEFTFGGQPLARVRGRAYHDRNHGTVALHELGIDRWRWARFPLPDRERIVYLLWPSEPGEPPRLEAMEIGAAGHTRRIPELEIELSPESRTLGGLSYPKETRLLQHGEPWGVLRHRRTVDSGPFYLRFQSELGLPTGERILGWSEQVHPDRVDLPLHRPLVRMRVTSSVQVGPVWTPLFTGPTQGRLRRLLVHMAKRVLRRGHSP